jgi:integrase
MRHYIGFNISLQMGMGMGEVIGLRWSDIDFDGKKIFVRQTLNKIDEGRTSAALRVIYISESLSNSLKAHKELLKREKKVFLQQAYYDYDLVMCTKSGNWVHPNNFRRAFKVTVDQLDIPKIRLHDL